MESGHHPILLLHLLLLSTLISGTLSHSLLKLHLSGNRKILRDDAAYCRSWCFVVETNDAGPWKQVPSKCVEYVKTYLTQEQYALDSDFVASESLEFARTVEVSSDGKDAWVFDVDETLLSNLPYYADHGYGYERYDATAFNAWVETGECPVLSASLRLYNELQGLGFRVILLTGRDEHQRNCTENNLLSAGYRNWEKLILRGESDQGKGAALYKSEKRNELKEKGYRIHGNSGDQWSDLNGFATATRSFKLPNPMYFIA